MPSYAAEATAKQPRISRAALFGLSPGSIANALAIWLGHTLARIEREFILQTLRSDRGNRTPCLSQQIVPLKKQFGGSK